MSFHPGSSGKFSSLNAGHRAGKIDSAAIESIRLPAFAKTLHSRPARSSVTKPLKHLVAAALACACASPPALAAYPEQPIRIIAPYAAGGSSDVLARALGDELGKELGQPVVVENRPGAGSMIGTQYVAGEPANGYTLLLVDVPFTIVPALYKARVKYNVERDFGPIVLLGLAPTYLFTHPAFPATNVAGLVQLAKAKPATVSIGSGGNGALTHLMAELFMINTGTQLVHVPYKGASAAVLDLAAGQLQLSFTTMPTASALHQAGKLRPLAVGSPRRTRELPEVPTFQESGVPNMNVESWWGLVAAAGTSPAILTRLREAMAKVMKVPLVRTRIEGAGVTIPEDTGANALQQHIRTDAARWQEVIQRANIKAD
jgi:tripartite-type tricarboxylate transporter receptor subunit TctC